MFAFVGPGFMVAVGYMDPGNWGTDLAGGSQYGPNRWERMVETADGWLAVAATTAAERDAMALITGRSQIAAEAALRRASTAEWLARFDAAGVPAAPVTERFWERFADDAQLQALGAIAAPGDVQVTQRWIRSSAGDAEVRGPAPGLGEHDAEFAGVPA